ncbi:phosphoglucosamine mutase [Candidatus Saccharibacteria bacterium CG_4_10_14_0_2_um_filter_52_9]|nr:MAG: phosphoglucosamine mutase [Candidatus Saccharibacteria bacterium CG_4_10_14_0_2_um_filter_52_9]
MSRDLFGTDGVRGLAGDYPLDHDGAVRIGMAVGTHFAEPGQRVVMGCDPRESSAGLIKALTEGLNKAGVHVTFAGVLPTPGLAYLTRQGDEFVVGVMVTASHNPRQYNGVKVFTAKGGKLNDATEATLNKLIVDGCPERDGGLADDNDQLVGDYENFLVASADGLKLDGVNLAIDSANGAGSGLAERVFTRLGATVTSLSDAPDGQNINESCGATNTKALAARVVADKLDMGIALDGDADRVMLIDGQGRLLTGDHIMYILAVCGNLKGVVVTVMTNLGVENALRDHGVEVERSDVGDRYVLEELGKTGYHLGGEQAGHIILPDLLATGDGMLAAVQTVKAVAASGHSLAQWFDDIPILPQALVNIKLTDKSRLASPEVQAFITEQVNQLGDNGRLLIRPSGTEPLARVMVEAPDAQTLAEQIAAKLEELL